MQNKTVATIFTTILLLSGIFGCVSAQTQQERLIDYLIADGYSEAQSKFDLATEYSSSFFPDTGPYPFIYVVKTEKYSVSITVNFAYYDYDTEMINKFTIVYFEDETGKRRCFQKENVFMEKGTDFIEFQGEAGDPYGTRIKNPVLHLWH